MSERVVNSVENQEPDGRDRIALSVVVPVHNAEETLGAQLAALAEERLSEPWEVIVVDDASTDGSAAVAASFADRLPLSIVHLAENGGAGHARNVGASHARAEYLGFLDADDVIAPGWLEAVIRALREYDAAGSRFDVETLNPPSVRASRRGPQQDGLQSYDYPPFLPHCGGCGLMVRRAVHEAIDGFDTTLPSLEDTDYTWRLQLAGYSLGFAHDAVVRIRYREGHAGAARQAYRYGFYNVVLYVRYRDRGMEPLNRKAGVRRALRLLGPSMLSRLGSAAGRRRWTRLVSWQLGRVAASLSFGVWAL